MQYHGAIVNLHKLWVLSQEPQILEKKKDGDNNKQNLKQM